MGGEVGGEIDLCTAVPDLVQRLDHDLRIRVVTWYGSNQRGSSSLSMALYSLVVLIAIGEGFVCSCGTPACCRRWRGLRVSLWYSGMLPSLARASCVFLWY